jgi:hypothetical protein
VRRSLDSHQISESLDLHQPSCSLDSHQVGCSLDSLQVSHHLDFTNKVFLTDSFDGAFIHFCEVRSSVVVLPLLGKTVNECNMCLYVTRNTNQTQTGL